MAQHNDFGKEGEQVAQRFLVEHGYHILTTNWMFGKGELDIVCEKDDLLIVVEVKSRSTEYFEHPKDAITNAKIRRIVNTTHEYIMSHDLHKDVRFDVVSVIPDGHSGYKIEHIEDAFLPPVN